MSRPDEGSFEAAFAAALLARDAVPAGLAAPAVGDAGRRLAVHRNNVAVSLVEALMIAYPAIVRLLGEDYFRALAGEFVRAHPPRSPVLMDYGRGFADFIEGFPPLHAYPWLGDVARLERAWSEAYHGADSAPLSPDALGRIAPQDLARLRFLSHPAARLLRSRYPAVSIFRANRFGFRANRFGEGESARHETERGQDALVTRPGLQVAVSLLPAGGAAFLAALLSGGTLGEAAQAGLAESGDFDLAAALAGMLAAGAFAGLANGI